MPTREELRRKRMERTALAQAAQFLPPPIEDVGYPKPRRDVTLSGELGAGAFAAGMALSRTPEMAKRTLKGAARGVTLGRAYRKEELGPEGAVGEFMGGAAGAIPFSVAGGTLATLATRAAKLGPKAAMAARLGGQAVAGTGYGAAQYAESGKERARNIATGAATFPVFEAAPAVVRKAMPFRVSPLAESIGRRLARTGAEAGVVGAGVTGVGLAAGESPEEAAKSGATLALAHTAMGGAKIAGKKSRAARKQARYERALAEERAQILAQRRIAEAEARQTVEEGYREGTERIEEQRAQEQLRSAAIDKTIREAEAWEEAFATRPASPLEDVMVEQRNARTAEQERAQLAARTAGLSERERVTTERVERERDLERQAREQVEREAEAEQIYGPAPLPRRDVSRQPFALLPERIPIRITPQGQGIALEPRPASPTPNLAEGLPPILPYALEEGQILTGRPKVSAKDIAKWRRAEAVRRIYPPRQPLERSGINEPEVEPAYPKVEAIAPKPAPPPIIPPSPVAEPVKPKPKKPIKPKSAKAKEAVPSEPASTQLIGKVPISEESVAAEPAIAKTEETPIGVQKPQPAPAIKRTTPRVGTQERGALDKEHERNLAREEELERIEYKTKQEHLAAKGGTKKEELLRKKHERALDVAKAEKSPRIRAKEAILKSRPGAITIPTAEDFRAAFEYHKAASERRVAAFKALPAEIRSELLKAKVAAKAFFDHASNYISGAIDKVPEAIRDLVKRGVEWMRANLKARPGLVGDFVAPEKTSVWKNSTGDVVRGDTIKFSEGVFGGSYRKPKYLGERVVTAEIINDSYGKDKQQHTFTLRVVSSEGHSPLKSGDITTRKGRNVYRNGTERLEWKDESARNAAAEEKHQRGDWARAERSERREEGPMKFRPGFIRIPGEPKLEGARAKLRDEMRRRNMLKGRAEWLKDKAGVERLHDLSEEQAKKLLREEFKLEYRPPQPKPYTEAGDNLVDRFIRKGVFKERRKLLKDWVGKESFADLTPEERRVVGARLNALKASRIARKVRIETGIKPPARVKPAPIHTEATKEGSGLLARMGATEEPRKEIRKTVEGKKIDEDLNLADERGRTVGDKARVLWENVYRKNKPTRAEREWFRDHFKEYVEAEGKMDIPAGLRRNAMEEYRKAWKSISEEYLRRGKELKIEGLREIEGIGYFPHWLTREARELLAFGGGEKSRQLIEQLKPLIEAKGGNFSSFLDRVIMTREFGSLEYPRLADLPETVKIDGKDFKVLETSPEIVARYIENGARRLGIIETFGQGSLSAKLEPRLRAHVEALYPDNAAKQKEQLEFWRDAINVWEGAPVERSHEQLVAQAGKAAWNITRLNQLTWSWIANAVQGDVPTIGLFGARRTLLSKIMALTGDKELRWLQEQGAIHREVLGEMTELKDIQSLTRTIATKGLHALGVNAINRHVNKTGIKAALNTFRDAARRGDAKRLGELKELFGFTQERVDGILRNRKLSDQDRIRIAQKTPAKINAIGENPFEVPNWWRRGNTKYFLAYLAIVRRIGITFSYVTERAIKEKNPIPLITMLTAAGVSEDVKDRINGLIVGKDQGKDAPLAWRILDDVLQSAVLGVPGAFGSDVVSSIKYNKPLAEELAPPILGPEESVRRNIVSPLVAGKKPKVAKAVSELAPITKPVLNRTLLKEEPKRPKPRGLARRGMYGRSGRYKPKKD